MAFLEFISSLFLRNPICRRWFCTKTPELIRHISVSMPSISVPSKGSSTKPSLQQRSLLSELFKPKAGGCKHSFHKPNDSFLNLLRRCNLHRPLTVIEEDVLKRSRLLPSILSSLTRRIERNMEASPQLSTLLLSDLGKGKCHPQSPYDFCSFLTSLKSEMNGRIDDLSSLCMNLYNTNTTVSLSFLNGTISISSSDLSLANTVIPLVQSALPWNDSWTVLSDSSTQCADTATVEVDDQSVHYSCDNSSSQFSNISLREIFPDLTLVELEVFSSWSDA